MSHGLDVLGFSDSVSCARVGPVFVIHVVGALSLADLDTIRRAHERFPELDAMGYFGMVEPEVPLPTGAVLRRATAMARMRSSGTVAEGTVLFGGGVRAAAARQMMQRIFSVGRSVPKKTFGDLPSGCAWIGGHFEDAEDLAFQLELSLVDLRRSRPRASRPPEESGRLSSGGRASSIPPDDSVKIAIGERIDPAASGIPPRASFLDGDRPDRPRFDERPEAPAPLHSFVDELLRREGPERDDVTTVTSRDPARQRRRPKPS